MMQSTKFIHWFRNPFLQCRAVGFGLALCWLLSGLCWPSFADEKPQQDNAGKSQKSASDKATSDSKGLKSESKKLDKPSADSKPQPVKSVTGKGEKNSTTNKPGTNKPADSATERLSPQRESASLAFAKKHHPELAELLGRLKDSHPDQYSKAIRELDRTRERLEKQRELDANRYGIMLHEWQMDSRVRLLAAQMTMNTSAELENELRQALLERHDVRLQLLTYDREKSKTRLQKMDEQIAEHVQNREASVDREFDRIKKSAEMRKKSAAKPAAKRTGEKEK